MGTYFKARFRLTRVISGVLLVCSCLLFGRGIILVSPGASLGTMTKAFLPAIAFLSLFITFHIVAQQGISLIHLLKPEKLSNQFWWIGIPLAFAFYQLILIGGEIGLTYSLVGILVISGLFLSLFLFLTREDAYGIIPFLLIYPFLGFLEWSFPDISGEVYLGPLILSPSIVSIWLIFLVCLVRSTQHLKNDKISKKLILYMLAWIGITCVSALQSIDPVSSFRQCSVDLFTLPIFALLFIIRLRTEAEARTIFYAILTCIVLRIAIVYYFLLRSPEYAADPTIISLYGLNYILLSGGSTIVRVGLMGIPVALALSVVETAKKRKALFLFISVCLVSLVLISQTRAVWMSLFLTLPVFLVAHHKRLWVYCVTTISVSALLVTIFAPDILDKGLKRLSRWNSMESFKYDQRARIDAFRSGFRMVHNYPLLGISPGMWPMYYPEYSDDPAQFFRPEYKLGSSHNFFIQIMATSGFLGMTSFVFLIGYFYKRMIRAYKTVSDDRIKEVMVMGILWGVTLFLLDGDDTFYRLTEYGTPILDRGILFWTFMGLGMALSRIYGIKYDTTAT